MLACDDIIQEGSGESKIGFQDLVDLHNLASEMRANVFSLVVQPTSGLKRALASRAVDY